MRPDPLREFIAVRAALTTERSRIQEQLRKLNQTLEFAPLPSLSPIDGATSSPQELAGTRRSSLPAVQKRPFRRSSRRPRRLGRT